MVRIGHFEKFLEMVLWLPCLSHEVALGGRNILLTRIVCFLVIAIVAGSDCNVPGALLLPPITALGTFHSSLDGNFGWCCAGTFTLCRMKAAPIASSPEACQVAISSRSLVVLS
jgi:hypothetical protein